MGRDWKQWHERYENPESSLSRRLLVVQAFIARALDELDPGPVRVISMCAGEGRDLLGTLADHPRRGDVVARLVELDPELADRARAAATAAGLSGIDVVTGDAALVDAYRDTVPADLVLVCGVFGNITDDDIERTVRTLPQLCAPGGRVIWTRHREPPDVTPAIRHWFTEAGFSDVGFESAGAGGFGVGIARYDGPELALVPGTRLFSFVR